MTDPRQALETMEVALLTVNVDHSTVINLTEIAAQMPWKIIQSDFDYCR